MTAPAPTTPCPRCGTGISAGSRFCANCGESLSGEVPARVSVGAAVAREGRLSDSGALELKTLLIAATLGDYDIRDELGRGGMAVVFKAIEVHLRRPVAIKILPPDLTYAKGATERFSREAQTAAALDHPNIIPIYRISAGGKLCWYAMKYLEGRSLSDILAEKGLLTVSESIAILEQVANALDYAHQHGVIHRDVKPGNVMLDVNGRVTVTDFGIAKELTSGALTGSGAILGTPYYMSPEQCRGGQGITGAADQYSLGVMAYQMVSGQLPFDADSAIDVIHKHVSEPPPPLETLLPSLPRHVVSAINRALAKKASERFPTVTSFVAAMRHAPDDKTLMLSARLSQIGRRRSGIDKAPTLAGSTKRIAGGLVILGAFAAGMWWLGLRSGGAAALPEAGTAAPSVSPGAPAARPTDTRKANPGLRTNRPARTPARPASTPTRPAQTAAAPAAGQPVPQAAAAAPAPAAGAAAPPANGPTGTLNISIQGGFADITIDGHPPVLQQKRVTTVTLPAANYTVHFARPGYVTETRQVRVVAGQEASLTVSMHPSGTP
ncbi:MAG: protein kinase [Gemmatimonadales bacterium]